MISLALIAGSILAVSLFAAWAADRVIWRYGMSIILVAVCIVAAFLGGGAYWLATRAGAGAWLSFTLGLLVALLVFAAGPSVLKI